MEEFAYLWSYQENTDELKQKLLYTTIELEAVKSETEEERKRNTESTKELLQLLKIAYQERDEAKGQLQKLLNKIMPSNEQQIFNNCFSSDQVQEHHQGPFMIPAKANSSITESNSLSEAYNHSSSPVDSFFDTISSPEFSNINVDQTSHVQDYNQNNGVSKGLYGLPNGPKVDQVDLVMENMIKGKTLPQKGKLLQAVAEAGPLLHSLLLAGPLPNWRNPPPVQTFHIPPMVTPVDQTVVSTGNLFKSPMMMLKQTQPFSEMGCASSSKMMAVDGGGGLSFSGGSNYQGRMMEACPSANNFGTIGKRQRLH